MKEKIDIVADNSEYDAKRRVNIPTNLMTIWYTCGCRTYFHLSTGKVIFQGICSKKPEHISWGQELNRIISQTDGL